MISALLASNVSTFIILGLLVVAIVVMFVLSSRRRKKQEQDAKNLVDAVKPGNKVKTIGGICGIVVEIDNEENTFVLETGTEQSGKCYIKFDKQAIYQTDAVVKPEEAKSEPATTETVAEPVKADEIFEEVKAEEHAPVADAEEPAPEVKEEKKAGAGLTESAAKTKSAATTKSANSKSGTKKNTANKE